MAYINTDTVMNNYKYYQELKSKLESQQQVAEKQLEIKMQDLEKEYKNLSTRVTLGLMKEEEAQAVFAPKQQEVEKFRTNISDQLMAQEKQLTLQLYDTVINFLQKYNKKAGYSYIFGYTKGGNIMIAPKSHDLTKDVLKGLNGDYLKRKIGKLLHFHYYFLRNLYPTENCHKLFLASGVKVELMPGTLKEPVIF